MSKERKLDLFTMLRAIDQRNGNWLAAQPEDARKEFVPLLAMRWATCSKSDAPEAAGQLWLINRRVNHRLFDLQQHPELCYRLLASCGQKRSLQREWLSGSRKTASDNAALRLLSKHHPLANDAELQMLLSFYTRDDFVQFLADCGLEKDDAKECVKAYDKIVR